MGPEDLGKILEDLPVPKNGRLLVGIEKLDDAGVYLLSEDLALVQTVDFFTPIVDDPFWFGQIACANALSDVYAMGGEPITALNIVCFPRDLELSILKEILRGGLKKLEEAGVVLVGGHSVEDPEVKYGLSVTGIVHPQKIVRNQGAKPGDLLVLTKPIGTGIIATAIKAQMAEEKTILKVSEVMATLNKEASRVMVEIGVNACTDITGFGLLGHMCEMVEGTGVDFYVYAPRVPIFEEAFYFAKMGLVPGGAYRNKNFRSHMVDFCGVDEVTIDLLFDPQTSGGLLMAVAREKVSLLLDELKKRGERGWVIGEVKEGSGRIKVFGDEARLP